MGVKYSTKQNKTKMDIDPVSAYHMNDGTWLPVQSAGSPG